MDDGPGTTRVHWLNIYDLAIPVAIKEVGLILEGWLLKEAVQAQEMAGNGKMVRALALN